MELCTCQYFIKHWEGSLHSGSTKAKPMVPPRSILVLLEQMCDHCAGHLCCVELPRPPQASHLCSETPEGEVQSYITCFQAAGSAPALPKTHLWALLPVEVKEEPSSGALCRCLWRCRHSTATVPPSSSHHYGRCMWGLFCFWGVFLNKMALRALHSKGLSALPAPPAPPCTPPQDGARRPEAALRELPLPPASPSAMAATRLELNLIRLLSRCEALAAERRDPEEWRLEKVRSGNLLSPQQRGSASRNKLRQRVLWSVKTL